MSASTRTAITRPVEIMDLNDAAFERVITLRDAYRIMEEFARGYVERGDFPVSEFLYAYAAETRNGWTTDPAAPADFIAAADQILGAADGGR